MGCLSLPYDLCKLCDYLHMSFNFTVMFSTVYLFMQKTQYHVSQTLHYQNGFRHPTRPDVAVGGMTLPQNRLSEDELNELANYRPTLTYGQAKQAPPEAFVPGHVALDKKVRNINLLAELIIALSRSTFSFPATEESCCQQSSGARYHGLVMSPMLKHATC